MKAARALSLLVSLALGVTATDRVLAGPPKSPSSAPAMPMAKGEPLARRDSSEPVMIVRRLSEVQERIVRGDAAALAMQGTVASDIKQQLDALPAAAWRDPRNLAAAVKLVLTGGHPGVLDRILAAGQVPAETLALAEGALAFATGDRQLAAELLEEVDHAALPPTLAGLVALVKAILTSDGHAAKALAMTDEARLLSPGTHVEETALRLAIELAIALGDRHRFELSLARYMLRFPASLYGAGTLSRAAGVVGGIEPAALRAETSLMAAATARLDPSRRSAFLLDLGVAALRAGRLARAEAAGREAMAIPGVDNSVPSRARAIAAAAMVPGPRHEEGLRLLEQPASHLPTDLALLRAAARAVADFVAAPPSEMRASPDARRVEDGAGARPADLFAGIPALAAARARLAEVDTLLEAQTP
jgi:chemotaxis protein MotC